MNFVSGSAIKPFFFGILGLAALAVFPASPAAAEGNCPAGQYPIGGGNAGWVGCAPIPTRSDGPSQPPSVPMRAIDNYFAAASHPEANNGWISAGHSSQRGAEQAALEACNSAMGGGCRISQSNVNGALVIARGVEGGLYFTSDRNKASAEKKLHEYCRKQGDECTVINWLKASPGSAPANQRVSERPEIFAPKGDPRRLYGAMAWPDPAKRGGRTWIPDVWIVGGRKSLEQAKADVLAICQADQPVPCQVVLSGSDVYLTPTERNGNEVSGTLGPTADIAKARALKNCSADGKGKCRTTDIFYLGQEMVLRYDPTAFGKPYFTAQAWTKGDTAPWQNSVWSVAGFKDRESAQRSALAACKKESKAECEAASWSFNSKVALSIQPNGFMRIFWVNAADDPAVHVKKKCAETNTTCKLVKVIDARVPGAERVEVR